MKLSELISELERLKEKHGDLPVVTSFTSSGEEADYTIEFSSEDDYDAILLEAND